MVNKTVSLTLYHLYIYSYIFVALRSRSGNGLEFGAPIPESRSSVSGSGRGFGSDTGNRGGGESTVPSFGTGIGDDHSPSAPGGDGGASPSDRFARYPRLGT